MSEVAVLSAGLRKRPATARAVFFDVDGVLVHGYHARPERQVRWDENLLADLGVDPDGFRTEFIYGIFVKQVVVGRMSLIEALERTLPALGYEGSAMQFVAYWLSHDSSVNQPLLDAVARLRRTGDASLYIATNQDHMRAQWLWLTLGFSELFDDIFYSARLGRLKPTPAYFDASPAASAGRRNRPCSSTIAKRWSPAPAGPAGRQCSTTPSTIASPTPGSPPA